MGFECGFEKIKRYRNKEKESTALDYLITNRYLFYRDNEWINKSYPSFEAYVNVRTNLYELPEFGNVSPVIDEDYVNFYAKEENKYEDIDYWCSIGRILDDYITVNLTEIEHTQYYEVTKEFLDKALVWVSNQLEEKKLVPAIAIKSWRHIEETDEDRMVPCDGILVEDLDGNTKLIDFQYEDIFVASKGFDIEEDEALKSFKEAILKMQSINTDDYILLYYRSY